jgi:hypothetical protein
MVELVVEGRRFPADRPVYPLTFAQHMADDYEREVVVYEQTPGGPRVRRDVVRPTRTPWKKL